MSGTRENLLGSASRKRTVGQICSWASKSVHKPTQHPGGSVTVLSDSIAATGGELGERLAPSLATIPRGAVRE